MQFSELNTRIQNAKPLDFGFIIDDVINLFKKIWLKGFLLVLLIVIISFVLGIIFAFVGLAPDPYLIDENFEFDLLNVFSMSAIYQLPQTIIISFFSLGLIAGYYRMCKQVDLGEGGSEDIFYFFKGQHLGKVFYLSAIYAVIATVAQMLLLLPYIYVFVPLSFFSVILAFNEDQTEMEIVKSSFNLGNKKWFITFGTLFVTGIMGMLGIIACGIGLLFTISIFYLPVYFIYKGSIGFDEHREIDLIGTE